MNGALRRLATGRCVISEKFRQQYSDPKGSIIVNLNQEIVFATLAAAPTAGLAGYAKGCIFVNSAGALGSFVYANTGSNTSATWTNVL